MDNYLALIDGDEVVYKAGHASQKVQYSVGKFDSIGQWEEDFRFDYAKEAKQFLLEKPELTLQKIVDPKEEHLAILNIRTIIRNIKDLIGTEQYSIYLTEAKRNNFRDNIATLQPYKNRASIDKPLHYQMLRDYLIEEEFAVVTIGQEADDALGIMSSFYQKENKYDPVIVSQDKDLRMIPGLYLDQKTGFIERISELEAYKSFYRQLLTGDNTDDIPGISGMGPATAHKIIDGLNTTQEIYGAVLIQYDKAVSKNKFKYQTEKTVPEIVLEIGQLLWIRREPDQLWTPEITF